MKTRTLLLSLTVLFAAITVCSASDVNMGTWKRSVPEPEKIPPS